MPGKEYNRGQIRVGFIFWPEKKENAPPGMCGSAFFAVVRFFVRLCEKGRRRAGSVPSHQPGKAALAERLVHDDGDRVGQIERAQRRPHGDA